MGIIEKQATKNVIYSYLGAGLGFITIMWLSHLLSPAENGVIRILISYAALFAQFANLGFVSVTTRFFPYFKDKDKGHHGFLYYAIMVCLIGFLLCAIVFLFLKSHIIQSNQEKSKLFVDYLFYLMPLTFFTLFFNVFDAYLRAGYNSIIGSVTKEVIQRILILIAIVIYFLQIINFPVFLFLYITFTCVPTLVLIGYIIQQKEWHVTPVKGFMTKKLRSEIFKLSVYSIMTNSAGAIIVNIDAIMVNQLLGEAQTGIYGIAFYFGTIISIPARSISRITTSIVAENFKWNKIDVIAKLYNQSCNNQLAIAALLFIGICSNIDNIMQLLPPAFASGKNVILIISAGYVVELGTGINLIIITNSKYYKYDTYFVFLLVGITILANYIFIPIYGIAGSALASALTIVFVNALRYGLLYNKFNMQPYDINSVKLILIAIIAFLPGYFIPYLNNLYVDIAVRSCIVGGLFILLILKMEATPEINIKIRKNLKRVSINL
jgi:O-antigen/teichoic acid export membrane protein